MLKKLLKYDLKSVFKYWWIAAVTTFGISIVGGFALRVLEDSASEETKNKVPIVVSMMASSAVPLIYLALAAFIILTVVLVFARYYKNFFSDEGYLTFTLPVKKTALINSKLIMSGLASILTIFTVVIDVLIMLFIANFEQVIKAEFWKNIAIGLSDMYKELGVYVFVYALEFIAMFVLVVIVSNLFLFDCVAIACMIVKKAKVVSAIAIYYLANGAVSVLFTVFTIFGMNNIVEKLYAMQSSTLLPFLAFMFLGLVVMLALVTALLYVLQYWIADRKLNLS